MNAEWSHELIGIDGANPLGFLAALGVLRLCGLGQSTGVSRLSWNNSHHPVLHSEEPTTPAELSKRLAEGLRSIAKSKVVNLGDFIGDVKREEYEKFIEDAFKTPDPDCLRFAAAFGSNAIVNEKKGSIVPSQLSFNNNQGGKKLLKDFRTLAAAITPEKLSSCLFEPWAYIDEGLPTFRWDPNDLRISAHMAVKADDAEKLSVSAANSLAFIGMSFLASVPSCGDLSTTGFRRTDGRIYFAWPLWIGPLSRDSVACILQQPEWKNETGIRACFAAPRYQDPKGNLYFADAIAIDGSFPRR